MARKQTFKRRPNKAGTVIKNYQVNEDVPGALK